MTDSVTAAAPPPQERWPLTVSVVSAIAVFALLAVAGYLYAQSLDDEFSARASVLVLPAKPVNPDFVPSYYETLSRGQMVSTLAELIRLEEFEEQVADRYQLSDEQRAAVATNVSVVADTAMLQVVATSPDLNLAIAMADGVVDAATVYVGDLGLPYGLVPVGSAGNTVGETGPSTTLAIAAFTLVALVIALAYQQGVMRLARLLGRRRSDRINGATIEALGDDESAALGSDAPVGDDGPAALGSDAPVGDDGSAALGSDAPVGDDGSAALGSDVAVGDGDFADHAEDSDAVALYEALSDEPAGVPPAAE